MSETSYESFSPYHFDISRANEFIGRTCITKTGARAQICALEEVDGERKISLLVTSGERRGLTLTFTCSPDMDSIQLLPVEEEPQANFEPEDPVPHYTKAPPETPTDGFDLAVAQRHLLRLIEDQAFAVSERCVLRINRKDIYILLEELLGERPLPEQLCATCDSIGGKPVLAYYAFPSNVHKILGPLASQTTEAVSLTEQELEAMWEGLDPKFPPKTGEKAKPKPKAKAKAEPEPAPEPEPEDVILPPSELTAEAEAELEERLDQVLANDPDPVSTPVKPELKAPPETRLNFGKTAYKRATTLDQIKGFAEALCMLLRENVISSNQAEVLVMLAMRDIFSLDDHDYKALISSK